MKEYLTYVCEKCGKESRNKEEIYKCEASHLGLTVEEKHIYDELQSNVNLKSHILYVTKNEESEKEFDAAVEKLLEFERMHGIKK